jgi:hypothetical protein
MRILALLAPLALAACSSPRVYAPVTTTSAELAGSPAATYPLSAHGEVRLASYGYAEEEPDMRPRAIHLGMAVSNRSDETWVVDTSQQRMLIGGVEVKPDYSGHVEVPPRSTRFVDLVFPLPPTIEGRDEVPAFNVNWVVIAGNQNIVAGRTSFEARDVMHPRSEGIPVSPR